MSIAQLALLLSGGLILAGIAYPSFARSKVGWKVGAWTGGGGWALWYGFGALAYFAGMWTALGWVGLLVCVPLAFCLGLIALMALKRHVQMVALTGPILANLWYVS